ncbi:MAG: MmcQ/YjbR family DNA-binding protein [Rhizomicrobium sp.]
MANAKAKAKPKPARKPAPFARLKAKALSYPEATEEHPWGDTAIKVRGKTFIFLGEDGGGLSLSVKLPASREFALEYPFTRPTPYGLGKSGWVSSQFAGPDAPPMDVLEAWLNESYRAIAPKKLTQHMD